MKRRVFHVVLGLILLACLVCPFVEMAIDWNESILTTGYDTESTVAVIALLLVLALALARLLAVFLPAILSEQPLVASPSPLQYARTFVLTVPDLSPPLPPRI